MKTDDIYTSYTDLLKDRQFIQWQLMPDEALNDYWVRFFKQHPELEEELQKAITYLRTKGLNESPLTQNERIALFKRIQKSVRRKKKVAQRRLILYASTSAAAIALLVIGIMLFSPLRESVLHSDSDRELIVGELLNNQDIQFITSGETLLFQDDVDVTLNKEGTAEIMQGNRESSKIKITQDELNSLVVPYGKRSTVTLTDGSKIWLNSGSVLEFPARFVGNSRGIRLASGEMYIEVTHDEEKPFHVQTGNLNIRVHGTKFNITNYSGSPQSVVLVEGSISLQMKGNKELFIKPSEKATYSEGVFNTEMVDVAQFISWKDGYFSFDKTPMTEVLQQIGKYYNLSFDFNNDINLQKRSCTGKIYLSDNLDNVMTTVTLLTSTKYEKQENKIYITNDHD
ncbi:FecR family protein [Proteiniphilum sp. X52]|uniref:FecR family protein n=1 Tax=Proteiniphilum sp. X52 TaxID=2382159 RepID=UPI000F0A2538|nr:FecR family protein [Proteiniphilum sp. X52]RNC66804.1 FecR family protein [Proteiniphilum sp. X52]